ncbi:unannotated protein [freshwater metagenome]|uniref:Unannotated protein n=1 Tax=freshwater metagenome TaxID=449393 RepID=A0A6J6WUP2_9ZZZZ
MGAQHQGRSIGNLGNIVYEYHTQTLEMVDHKLIVNYLVVAVDRRSEDFGHPVQGLDRLLHAGTKAARRCKEDLVDVHETSLTRYTAGTGPSLRGCRAP